MALPYLANLFAFWDADPRAVDTVERALRADATFGRVARVSDWVVADAPLPNGDPVPSGLPAGLVIAEGAAALDRWSTANREGWDGLVRLVTDHPNRLGRIPGDWGFVHLGPRGSVTAVRSCAGLVPLYLHVTKERVAVATRIGDLVAHLPDPPAADPLPYAIWMTGHSFFPDDRSFLAGVSVVSRGSAAVARPGRAPQVVRYWDPRPAQLPPPRRQSQAAHAAELRRLLVDYLEVNLDPVGANLLTLSGGVDSSSLAALCVGAARRSVATLSFVPPGGDDLAREIGYLDHLQQQIGVPPGRRIPLDPATFLELLASAPPVVFPIAHPALGALPRLCEETEIRVMLGGEFADEVGGSAATFPDWVSHTSPLGLIQRAHRLPHGPSDVPRWMKWRILSRARHRPFPAELSVLAHPEVRAEYNEWRSRHVAHDLADGRPLAYLAARAELDGWVPMNWEACSALGVRRALPFFHREIIELAFSCHPGELIGPGTKRLLRVALAGDVPAFNLSRPDKGAWRSGELDVDLPPIPEPLAGVVDPDVVIGKNVPWRLGAGIAQLAVAGAAFENRRRSVGSLGV